MDFESSLDLQSLIVTVVGVYTGMRVKDMHGILARNVTQVEHTPDAPRHFKILMTNTKNDMEGKSGDKGLAHYVPCICLSVLQESESLVFARRLCRDCEIDCAVPCPYNVVLEYISRIPDPSGSDHDHKVSSLSPDDPHSSPPLPFFRAVTTRGPDRPFTKSPLGVNSMRESIGKVNSRLPEYLQLKNPTGHTPRRSMITIAVNAKVDPVVVALATKHKDPKSFLGYIEAAPGSVMAAGLAVAVAAKDSRRRSHFVAGIDLDLSSEVLDVDSSLSSCSSSSLAVCTPVSDVQRNIVVPDLAPVVPSSSFAPKSGNVYNFHFN